MTDRQPPGTDPRPSAEGPPEPVQPDPPRGPSTDRVRFSTGSDGQCIAFRPGEVLTTRGEEALEVANRFPNHHAAYLSDSVGPFSRLTSVADPMLLVEELKLYGIKAQPNYVYFAHGSVSLNPVHASPVHASPVHASPVHASAGYSNPDYPIPFAPDPFSQIPPDGYRPRQSSCLPPTPEVRTDDLERRIHTPAAPRSPHVIVLDTGLANSAHLPAALMGGAIRAAVVPRDTDEPDEDGNKFLDPAAGHGTFIAGVIGGIAPGCKITLHRVLSTFADGAEWDIVLRLRELLTTMPQPRHTLLNLSFGGYVLDHPHALAWAIRALQAKGVTVVASAGNDGTWQPQYPAALHGVIAVGALCPTGPAWFTNYGPWVDCCAPGVDLISTFFTKWNGDAPRGTDGLDPDDYHGWARWSGTSFAAPVVVGNLARLMMLGATAPEAVERIILAPELTRLPYLGTIVDAM